MRITVNGEAVELEARRLDAVLEELGHEVMAVATAVNGGFVPVARRAATNLAPGDRVEVVSPRQGG